MNGWLLAAILTAFVIADAIIVFFIARRLVMATWRPLADRFPAQAPAQDAVRRNFQSFGFGIVNMGYSIHVAADERFLHLFPARLARWFGMTPISIPWEAIEPATRRATGMMKARIGTLSIDGPAWCLGLAGERSEPEIANRK